MEKQYFGDSLLWLWGSNSYGKLGDNTGTDRSSPVQTITGGANWKQVACGREHTAAVKTDGTLWLWGENTFGNLGNGNGYILYSSPAETITGGTDWKQVACGYIHTAAIKTDGTLWLWGGNAYGQLGDDTTDNRSSPVQTVTGGTDWKQVACGDSFTVAIKTDGTLWTWGYNGYGQLGDDTTDTKLSPVQTIAGGTNWHQVACGYRHTAAVKNDGTLWTWGRNYNGQLGDDTTDNKSSPVQAITGGTNWKQVACGREHTAAVKADGTLWAWGRNAYGRLGDGTGTGRSSPVQTIMRGTIWKQVACGREHTAAIALGK
jgi:alpha-tubulin suppressor-like RCC1 family protein